MKRKYIKFLNYFFTTIGILATLFLILGFTITRFNRDKTSHVIETESPKEASVEDIQQVEIDVVEEREIPNQIQDGGISIEDEQKVSEYIPENWHLKALSKGDLNFDHHDDIVFIIGENGSYRNYINQDQKLFILFYNPNIKEYEIELSTENVPGSYGYDNDFTYYPIYITDYVLTLSDSYWTSMGSWSMEFSSRKYRYNGNGFLLIGEDSDHTHRATGNITKKSINYITGKVQTITSHISEDSEVEKWTNLEKMEPIYLGDW